MTQADYILMFKDLGFYSIELWHTLKHAKPIPSLYFNHSHGLVSFVGYTKDDQRFPHRLWERIAPQKPKDDEPHKITIVPKPGKEREAFVDLLNG